jgi:hypothetical protein
MKKLNLDALKERAEELTTNELLKSINGGLLNGCHTGILTIDNKTIPTPPTYPGTLGPWH